MDARREDAGLATEGGEVDILTPNGSGPAASDTLLDGLEEPHGLAFDGTTLYVAESSRINAYSYADGRATAAARSSTGCPTRRAPTCAASTPTP